MKYPSQSSKSKTEKTLGKFLRKDKLNPKIKMLTEIGREDKIWIESYDNLKGFIEKNNRFPCTNNDSEKKLANWIVNQRAARKGKDSRKLTDKRIEQLESLPNWKWDTDYKGDWEEKFDDLMCFVEKNNRLPSQGAKDKEELAMARWIQNQKRKDGFTREKSMIIEVLNLYRR